MGARAGKVPLTRAKFQLETAHQPLDAPDPDEDDFHGLYSLCYHQIFKTRPDRYFEQQPSKIAAVVEAAGALACPLRLFILSVMMAHSDTTPDRRFFGGSLAGPSATKRVKLYRGHARELFGTFDPEAVARIAGQRGDELSASLQSSEEVAAGWIVGHKARNLTSATDSLYAARELALAQAWLAIEPTYAEWVQHDRSPTKELKIHRAGVAKIDPRAWPAIATMRAKTILPTAARVLARYGVRPEHILIESPVLDATKLWINIGLAIRQVICLRYLRGDLNLTGAGFDLERSAPRG